MPVEVLRWKNKSATPKTVQLAINRCLRRARPTAQVRPDPERRRRSRPPSTRDRAAETWSARRSSGTAAPPRRSRSAPCPSTTSSEPEAYSSRGPVTHDFGPVDGTRRRRTARAPEMISKPDLAATDCGKTTFFAFLSGGFWRFCGTSAAAPHAAAVAALMLQAKPARRTPKTIREACSAAPRCRLDRNSAHARSGAGLVEAVGAIEEACWRRPGSRPPVAIHPSPKSPEEARAPGDWGSEAPTPVVSLLRSCRRPSPPPAEPEVTVEPQKPASPHLHPAAPPEGDPHPGPQRSGRSCASAPTRPTSPSPAGSTAASSAPARAACAALRGRPPRRAVRRAMRPATSTGRRLSSASRSSGSADASSASAVPRRTIQWPPAAAPARPRRCRGPAGR